ncbi:MAG: helix-turn-helix transcriptional regulator [Chloroflexi bacterium]|nr:MAG: helix-turn-helix transcriptional regulator [Chloroflexota bacterium]TMD55576.1 MAG: helix-turn-helix transcriptional regulator [Chloroflexota bacterium]
MSFAKSETPELIAAMLGAILRREREAAGSTLAETAAAAGLSPAYLSEVERGRKEISVERLLTLARTLRTSVATIYRELAAGLDGSEAIAVPADPQQRLRMAATVLSPQSLQTVADFSHYLLLREATPARRRIGFQPPGG